ncbi:MAG: hypothetical protein F6K48_35850 [Okeania sp. SIO3H1]|nr:hypothetical protein [Okeania sp. SIO3H1]
MRVLLDECLPRRLARDLGESHRVTTVPRQGWSGITDTELMRRIPDEFDAFITMDATLPFQQNVSDLGFILIVIRATSNRYETLKPLVQGILLRLDRSTGENPVFVSDPTKHES